MVDLTRMQLQHVLVTRFSLSPATFRSPWRPPNVHRTASWSRTLDPARLATRFTLFELFCLPSVLGQTVKDFWWILLVDPALPPEVRDRLERLCTAHARTRLVEYQPHADLRTLGWLRPYIGKGTTHVATSNVDDDDLVAVDFVESTRAHAQRLADRGRLPSCALIGSHPVQWDFVPTPRAPLGFVKPWHRGQVFVNTALTFLAQYPQYDLSALAFRHRLAARYFDPRWHGDEFGTLRRLRQTAEAAGDDWRRWSPDTNVHAMDGPSPAVVVVNHVANEQASRLFEARCRRVPVEDARSFPGMAVDFDAVRRLIPAFRCSPAVVAGIVGRSLRAAWSASDHPLRERIGDTRRALKIPLLYALGLLDRDRRT